MKAQNLILFLAISITSSSAFLLKSNKSQDPAQSIARALSDVIREFYTTNDVQFIIYGQQTQHMTDVLDFTFKELSLEKSIRFKHLENVEKFNFYQSSIILTKSEENLSYLNKKSIEKREKDLHITTHPKYKKLRFLIYTEEITTLNQLRNVFKDINENILQGAPDLRFFEFFIINEHKSVDLVANVLYSEDSCGIFVQKSINTFDKITQKWETKLKNFEQFETFNGCILTMIVPYGRYIFYSALKNLIDPETEEKIIQSGSDTNVEYVKNTEYRGVINELITTLENRHNFTANIFAFHHVRGYRTYIHSKNFIVSSDGAIILEDGEVMKFFIDYAKHMTSPIYEEEFYYLVSDNDLYSNYEKLFYAFDFTTWMFILMIYGMTFLAIGVVHLTSKKFRKIVFGEGVNIPAYNALGIFFGIGQIKLPKKYFGRFILLLYIWFCLMIRTCYQSKMFEFITSDMRKPLPKTVEDLKYWNYTIVTFGKRFTYASDRIINERDSPKTSILDYSSYVSLYADVIKGESTEKYAFLVTTASHAQFNGTHKTSLKTLSDEKLPITVVFTLPRNSILSYQLDNVLDQFITVGITKHLYDYGRWFLHRPIDVEIEDPRRILTLEMLEFGFVLWFAACCVSTFVFVCECRSLWLKRKLRILIGLIDFLIVLRNRIQDYHDRW